ncbi:hypothetical protein NM208_g7573 [Fusarium decemcellulare]|uniref:Uncharacterized protein n=1 Tax=Fusarium decemcellulare TaxID=57161 RepID=A0ACC1S8I8_9HYPO|nr:hypothetical protein NM208_g7573 [Fusarium decemcellulare]
MPLFEPPPKPTSPMGYHRVLSPNAAVKVSPICLGGISIGNAWSDYTGKNEDPFELLDTFFELGGNFIDTSNVYNEEESEKLVGQWMEDRSIRDQMVIATKYSAHYRAYNRENEPLQSNFIGNSVKSMHVSVRQSLKKLRTDYIDILYVHWWDFTTSVEEVMRGLHAHVMAKEVLYLDARQHGLTPFSVYQGMWNASFRDMEGEIIPMCEDQGMAVVPWGALGRGQLLSAEQRRERENNPDAARVPTTEKGLAVSDALERLAVEKNTSVQAIALAYLFHQSTYVFPIAGVNTVAHVKSMPDALRVQLSKQDIDAIHEASPYDPGFPMSFLYSWTKPQKYDLSLTAANHQQIQMAAWVDAPPKALVSSAKT